jgi:hypothetical protein
MSIESTQTGKAAIDTIVNQFYNIFNNTGNVLPDWKRIHDLCIAETIIIKKNGLDQTIYDLESFIEPRKKILTDGTLTDFSENEITETTNIIGNIAQRFSVFEKSGLMSGEHFTGRGNKLFQFIHTARMEDQFGSMGR